MKKTLFTLSLLVFATFGLLAQTNVQLTVHHKLGNEDFQLNMAAKNNMDNDFQYIRVEYYISEIILVHDGGTETMVEDLWVLVDASEEESTTVDLGEHNVTSLEGIKLHVGVDSAHNHLDPAGYASDHPLAPQFPSMHWGWAAGYRFAALEGWGGPQFNQKFELHGLTDQNYFTTEIELSEPAANGQLDIQLDADYIRALEDINVNSGVIFHGANGAAKQSLENFRDYVFSPSSGSTSAEDLSDAVNFSVFPNPVTTGVVNISSLDQIAG